MFHSQTLEKNTTFFYSSNDKLYFFMVHTVQYWPIRIHNRRSNTYQCSCGYEIHLQYNVKMQYVQISNIIDTSIKHPISITSTPMVKGCMDIVWYGRYWILKVIEEHWLSPESSKVERKYFTWNLKYTYCILLGRANIIMFTWFFVIFVQIFCGWYLV